MIMLAAKFLNNAERTKRTRMVPNLTSRRGLLYRVAVASKALISFISGDEFMKTAR
jgi:hypothetical protein